VQQQVEQHSWKAQKDAGVSHGSPLTQRSWLMTEFVTTVRGHDRGIMSDPLCNL
jgi:hypothetical protein